jgi:hypothetical protein
MMLLGIQNRAINHFTKKGVLMPEEPNGQDIKDKEVPEEVTTTEQPAELDEDVKERTKKNFEELKEHNRQLKEENEALKASQPKQPSALESLVPNEMRAVAPNLSNQQVDDIVKGLVDENGYLDQALLENTLRTSNQQVAQARAEANQARLEAKQALSQVNKFGQDREVRIAHKKFPVVDPESSKYDPNFFKLVKNELLGAMYEGRKLEFVDACREVSKVYSPTKDDKEVKAKAVEEYKENVASKSSLNPTGSSRPDIRSSKDDLVEGTRKGDAASIYERLANINS